MQVKEIDINNEKIKGYKICKKKYKISFLGGPTTPTYSRYFLDNLLKYKACIRETLRELPPKMLFNFFLTKFNVLGPFLTKYWVN